MSSSLSSVISGACKFWENLSCSTVALWFAVSSVMRCQSSITSCLEYFIEICWCLKWFSMSLTFWVNIFLLLLSWSNFRYIMRKSRDKHKWLNLHIKEEVVFASCSSISNQVVICWHCHNIRFEGQLHTHTPTYKYYTHQKAPLEHGQYNF